VVESRAIDFAITVTSFSLNFSSNFIRRILRIGMNSDIVDAVRTHKYCTNIWSINMLGEIASALDSLFSLAKLLLSSSNFTPCFSDGYILKRYRKLKVFYYSLWRKIEIIHFVQICQLG